MTNYSVYTLPSTGNYNFRPYYFQPSNASSVPTQFDSLIAERDYQSTSASRSSKKSSNRMTLLFACIGLFVFAFISLIIVLLILAFSGKFHGANAMAPGAQDLPNRLSPPQARPQASPMVATEELIRSNITLIRRGNLSSASLSLNRRCGRSAYLQSDKQVSAARIIRGGDAIAHSMPWLVSIRMISDGYFTEHVCGGSLISNRHVLTAAHCVHSQQASSIAVIVGLHYLNQFDNSQVYYLDTYWLHEAYVAGTDGGAIQNDIALLKLARPIFESTRVGIVCMSEYDEDIMGNYVIALGWGNAYDGFESQVPSTAQIVRLQVINGDSTCDQQGAWDSESMLCVKDYDSIRGANVCVNLFLTIKLSSIT
jgi:hypothetical protein